MSDRHPLARGAKTARITRHHWHCWDHHDDCSSGPEGISKALKLVCGFEFIPGDCVIPCSFLGACDRMWNRDFSSDILVSAVLHFGQEIARTKSYFFRSCTSQMSICMSRSHVNLISSVWKCCEPNDLKLCACNRVRWGNLRFRLEIPKGLKRVSGGNGWDPVEGEGLRGREGATP